MQADPELEAGAQAEMEAALAEEAAYLEAHPEEAKVSANAVDSDLDADMTSEDLESEEGLYEAAETRLENQYTTYVFLRDEMGMNPASAAGVMANIYYESTFNPISLGDGGTSYGICQWHNARWQRMLDYCSQNGYDSSSLEGQLQYLKYEFTNKYPNTLNMIMSVDNSTDGAYAAAAYMCLYYEVPAKAEQKAVTRGTLAYQTMYPRCLEWGGSSTPSSDSTTPTIIDPGSSTDPFGDNSNTNNQQQNQQQQQIIPAQTFTDVTTDKYFYKPVSWAVQYGITSGLGDGTFGASQTCTRAQAVTFLYKASGSPTDYQRAFFTDVPEGAYFQNPVSWAASNLITTGTSATTFGPNEDCTRAQIVTFLYNASNCPPVSPVTTYQDVPVNSYYAKAVSWASANGITSGYSSATFGSGDKCNRAQIMTFLYRMITKGSL